MLQDELKINSQYGDRYRVTIEAGITFGMEAPVRYRIPSYVAHSQ